MRINSLSFLFIFTVLILIISKSVKHSNPIDNNKYDEISLIVNWAKKNNIYIHDYLSLKKNELNDIKHNFYYFKSNTKISNNTLLLKIPSSIMISQNSLVNFFKKSKSEKLSTLWEKIQSIDKFINYSSAKQLFYISIILSDSTFRQKGKFFKKHKDKFR